jgi:hypothetical protein
MPGGRNAAGSVSRPAVLLLGLMFCLSRLVILPLPRLNSDVGIYAQYAHEYESAARAGIPFYEFHARTVQDQIDTAREAGKLAGSRDEYKDVEYPPLALAVLRLPRLWMGGESGEGAYYAAYRLSLAVVDLILFFLLLPLVPRLFPQESRREQTQRLLVYLVSTAALWHLLYDRLDLLLALVVMLALTLLLSWCHYAWSFAVLALAINFKLAPLVLAPVWILGSLPADQGGAFFRPRTLFALGARTLLLGGMVLACFLPFYLLAGEGTLGFLTYHRGRGLEIGSVYSSVPLALQVLGSPVALVYSYGSINVTSTLTPTLVALAPWLAGVVLLAAAVGVLIHFQSVTAPHQGTESTGTLAQVYPRHILGYALVLLMVFIATSKVFSPQYLLWLAPLVCLVPLTGRSRPLVLGSFLLV